MITSHMGRFLQIFMYVICIQQDVDCHYDDIDNEMYVL